MSKDIAYTDYPFLETDEPYKEAPIRQVKPLSYDFDKYVTVEFEGKEYSFKTGYLYEDEKRFEEAKHYSHIAELPETTY